MLLKQTDIERGGEMRCQHKTLTIDDRLFAALRATVCRVIPKRRFERFFVD